MRSIPRPTLIKLVAAMLVLTVVQSVILVSIPWFGNLASQEIRSIATLFNVMIVLSALVFSVVVVMMAYAVWRFRAKPGDESDGEPIHGNTRLEIIWTAVPTVIVLVGAVYSTIVLNDIEARAADDEASMRVDVTAQQFAWRFDYPEQGVTSTELHVPVGTQAELHLNSLDVIHSFWVPEWGIKRDAVPGAALDSQDEVDDVVPVTPDEEGYYQVVCMELCGWGHATMRAAAVVESQDQFDAWVKTQNEIPKGVVSTGAAGGHGAGVYDQISD